MKTILSMFVVLLLQSTVFGQEASLNGKVTDVTNAALENVKITIDSMIEYTDKNGFFTFSNLTKKEYFVLIEMLGYKTEKIQIDLDHSTKFVSISLKRSEVDLGEVKIVGTKSINERQVEIGKIPIKPFDLPQAIAVVDRVVLEQQQSEQLSDVLKNTNGVYIMGATGGYQEEIAGRGFAFGSSNTF